MNSIYCFVLGDVLVAVMTDPKALVAVRKQFILLSKNANNK